MALSPLAQHRHHTFAASMVVILSPAVAEWASFSLPGLRGMSIQSVGAVLFCLIIARALDKEVVRAESEKRRLADLAESRSRAVRDVALDGRTLLERTLGALRESRHVECLCVAGPPELEAAARAAGADLFVRERVTGIDNLMAGVEALQARRKVLCAASDLPFVRPNDVDEVIERTPADAALTYTAFTRQEWEAEFPGSPATYIAFAEGEFTGGCAHVHDAVALLAIEPVLQRMFAARKSPVGMARVLGPRLLLRMLASHVLRLGPGPSTEDARRRAERITGVPCAVVRGCSPRLAADVDNPDDWAYARRLSERGRHR